jgi:hypothetical protein
VKPADRAHRLAASDRPPVTDHGEDLRQQAPRKEISMGRRSAVGLAGAMLLGLGLAACGNADTGSHHHAHASPSATATPIASGSPSVVPSPSPSASATPAVAGSADLTFQGGVKGSLTSLTAQQCTLGTDLVDVVLEGSVSGHAYWTTIDISDPALAAGSWSIAAPASQRQGGLENTTPQVGPTQSSPTYGAAPGASGTVILSSSPSSSRPISGSLSVTLLPVGANHGSQSLDLSGTFSCQAS